MNQPILQQIVDLIVPLVEPDKIILFGSYARGDATAKSDVDLLVLKKGLDDERGTTDAIYDVLFDNEIDIAVDVIPMDYDRYYELNDVIGYIYRVIEREGKILYETV